MQVCIINPIPGTDQTLHDSVFSVLHGHAFGQFFFTVCSNNLDKYAPSSQTYIQVEALFKGMWANHGDDISLQYAGTGALKSGFTRTGVRTKAGLADDGWKSGVRYYLNNFEDGHKQDALDLVSGAYTIAKGKMPIAQNREFGVLITKDLHQAALPDLFGPVQVQSHIIQLLLPLH